MTAREREYRVDYLARVEGEGALYIKLMGREVVDVKFRIFEPPRLFEALLVGRMYYDVPDITARICGICPIAYQMSSIHAFEKLFRVAIDPAVRSLRRLYYSGEWIESHMLHAFLLHAPDFLGYDDAVKMAKKHPEVVKNALKLKKLGNDIVALLGGREIHPVAACVGGFYRVPSKRVLAGMKERLVEGLEIAGRLLEWVADLDFPDFEQDYEFVALRHPDEYPMNEGRIVSNKGLDIAVEQYEDYFAEEQMPHSNALHSYIIGRGAYMVGPLSRINLNYDKLHDRTKEVLRAIGFKVPCRNPFKSIIARVAETHYAVEESLRIIDEYVEPPSPRVEPQVRAGRAHGCTEAPRGILYHRYDVDDEGRILSAKIVPPTAQNQKRIEEDLKALAPEIMRLPRSQAIWRFEQAVRNYDPCISCSVHFLKLEIEEE